MLVSFLFNEPSLSLSYLRQRFTNALICGSTGVSSDPSTDFSAIFREATGRRLQVSRAHALRKIYAVPEGCEEATSFSHRWNPDGRLLVHHGLAACGERAIGPLVLVTPNDGSHVVLAGETEGLPTWLDRAWASDRQALITADGSIVQGTDVVAGDPAILAAWWYRPRLVDVLR